MSDKYLLWPADQFKTDSAGRSIPEGFPITIRLKFKN